MDAPTAASITLSGKTAFKYGTLPYFVDAVQGMFVRVRVSSEIHSWCRVVKAENDTNKIYKWSPRDGLVKKFAVYLQVDTLPAEKLVRIDSISSYPPTLQEIAAYFEERENLNKEAVEELQNRIGEKLIKRPVDDDDAKKILQLNAQLNGDSAIAVNVNTVAAKKELHKRTLEKIGSASIIQDKDEPHTPLGLEASFQASATQPLLSTQDADDVALLAAVRSKHVELLSQVSQRTREQEMLVNLTERNKEDNRRWILTGEHFEKSASRKGNLKEATALWEVNDHERKLLCEAYDERKNSDTKKAQGGGSKASGEKANRSLDDPNNLFEHCVKIRQSQQSELASQITDEVLEASQSLSQRSPSAGHATLVVRHHSRPPLLGMKRPRDDSF